MENSDNTTPATPNYNNPNNPSANEAPPDPSNTSNIGQKVEQGVISKKDGISEQSAEWEDVNESNIPGEQLISGDAEKYIKDPSPEEANPSDEE